MKTPKATITTPPKPSPAIPQAAKTYGDTWYPSPDVFRDLFTLQVEKLASLHELVSSNTADAKKDLDSRLDELKNEQDLDREVADWIVDDWYGLNEQERWSTLLHIVALYHCLEHEIGILFKWRLSCLPKVDAEKALLKVHKWKELAKMLKNLCDVQIENVARYSEVDELRCLCNSVKHTGGDVSEELALRHKAYSHKKGDRIDHTTIDVARFREAATAFLDDLVTKVEQGTVRLFGQPPQ